MNRISKLFQEKKGKVLSIYFTAGFPELEDTLTILESVQEAGADLVEIGMPFSDPLADGPTIQASGQQALQNGMSLKKLMEQLAHCRPKIQLPILLMGYTNPVFQYGMENFLRDCKEVGVDGLILPDLPLSLYAEKYQTLFRKYELANILLVTPETSKERMKQINALCSGFIYAVSSSSTTGSDKDWNRQEAYFKKLEASQLDHPILTGFGVKDEASFQAASKYTHGAIIGTAFIKTLQKQGELKTNIHQFIKSIKPDAK